MTIGEVVFDFGHTLVGTIMKIEGSKVFLSMDAPNDIIFNCVRYNKMFFDTDIKDDEMDWVAEAVDVYQIDWDRVSIDGEHMVCWEHDPQFLDLGFTYYCPILTDDLFEKDTQPA